MLSNRRHRKPAHGFRTPGTALLLSLALAGPALATDGLEPIGLSTQSLIRGGTDVAIGDSALSQIDNPATLMLLPRSMDVSGEFLFPHTTWRGMYDTAESSVHCLPYGHAALALPVNDVVSVGVGLWSKSQVDTDFSLRSAVLPLRQQHTYANMRDIGLAPNVAVRVTDALSIGAGMRLELITGEFTSLAGPDRIHFGRGYGLGAGYDLGLHYRISPKLTFGLGYRSPTWFQDVFGSHTSSRLTNAWELYSPDARPLSFGRSLIDDLTLPQKVSAGLAWDATNRLRLSTEARWINYENSSMYRAKYDIDRSLNAALPSLIGYRDQLALMGGAEYKLTDRLTIGGGYHHASNPIAGRAFLPIADMIVVHHLTTGFTYKMEHWWFGGGYVLGLPNTLTASPLTRIAFGFDSLRGEIRQVQHSMFLGGGYRW